MSERDHGWSGWDGAVAAGEARLPVPIESAARARVGAELPSAQIIAQMLAERLNLPQARRRRRAEPDEATRTYANRPPLAAGRLLFDA